MVEERNDTVILVGKTVEECRGGVGGGRSLSKGKKLGEFVD